jgi:hypothetical protein
MRLFTKSAHLIAQAGTFYFQKVLLLLCRPNRVRCYIADRTGFGATYCPATNTIFLRSAKPGVSNS